VAEEYLEGVRDDGSKIEVTKQDDLGDAPKSKDMGSPSPSESLSTSKFGDPNAGLHGNQSGMMAISHLAAGRVDKHFYGHFLPEHFKKTSIISTSGRVR
jgi:hypothetical protein